VLDQGAAIANVAANDRRFKAIKALQARNPGLNVSLTIAVLESGPVADGDAFLRLAVQNGVTINIVNAMVMDYGHPVADMAAAAQTAAAGTLASARAAGMNATFANIGLTPMIGFNDTPGEVVSEANARQIVSFANANRIGRLSFWSIGRDQPCAGGGVSPNCSGLGGSALAFSRIFTAATIPGGGGGGNPLPPTNNPPTTAPPGNPPTTAPPAGTTTWVTNRAYTIGQTVTFNGVSYRCRQAHTSLPGWEPPNVLALWQPV
jgi:chitinase